jgi:hypothetical protein
MQTDTVINSTIKASRQTGYNNQLSGERQILNKGFCRAQARKNPRSDGVFLELFGYFFFQEKK